MTWIVCITLMIYTFIFGVVLGVLIAFELLDNKNQAIEINKNEWEGGDFL